jgi:signal transduction histidine kinase/CheY-like chemotaxis protein
MANKRFGYFMLVAFGAATILLLIIQSNFSANMDTMLHGNEKLMQELSASNHLREIDRDILGVESRIRAAIATDDTSHLEGIDGKVSAIMVYLDSLDNDAAGKTTVKYLRRLKQLSEEKVRIKNKLTERYLRLGNMNDTTFIANPRARRISDEITAITHKIYDIRQQKMVALSQANITGSKQARVYGNALIGFMFVSGGVLCWFILGQFRQQNQLIIKLDASEKRLTEALQVKENFLANMSHEIRTPLNSILGFTNLLQRRDKDLDSAEFIDSIQKAGENLMAIINDILDLSKIEAGMMRIVKAPFSVRGLIHSIETLFKERVNEKGLLLNCSIAGNVPDTLVGDATRLTQILVNLIGNALKFSDGGMIEVFVNLVSADGSDIQLGVKVKDAGIGISNEKLDKIFERFNQAEDSITRNYGGTGLGLSIVKTLIELQGGNITVHSIPGKGTEFAFDIPYTVADEQIDLKPQMTTQELKEMVNSSLQILVVDDNAMNQSLMKHLLMQWGASFTIAANGLEALETLKAKSFDLVLMDIQMPKMDGYTATRHIREDLKLETPIVAMTAHAMAGEREKCLSNGMNDYISKPINEEHLFKMINKFIGPKIGSISAAAPSTVSGAYQYIDLAYMKEISKGNIAYEKLVTGHFIEGIPVDIRNLEITFQNQDLTELKRIAHDMKTSVSIMGLLPLLNDLLDMLEDAESMEVVQPSVIAEVKKICLAAVEEARHIFQ